MTDKYKITILFEKQDVILKQLMTIISGLFASCDQKK